MLETHLNRVDTKATFQLIWALADESINKRPEILLKKKKKCKRVKDTTLNKGRARQKKIRQKEQVVRR